MASLICSVPICNKATVGNGLCKAHYNRSKYGKNGLRESDPIATKGRANIFIKEALDEETDECVLWPYARDTNGYGQIRRSGKTISVHRFVCTATHGAAPFARAVVGHTCGNGHLGCINPRHLRWITQAQNVREAKARTKRGRGHVAQHERLEILALKATMPKHKIAKKLNRSRQTIAKIIKDFG